MWLLGFFATRYAKKKTREMEDAFARAAGLDPEAERERRKEEQRRRDRQKDVAANGGWSDPTPRPKKIDSKVGEYIRYKEMSVEESTVYTAAESNKADFDSSGKKPIYEEQIVDVEWVDIEVNVKKGESQL